MLFIANSDIETNAGSLRMHGKGNLGARPRDEVVAEIFAAIKERR